MRGIYFTIPVLWFCSALVSLTFFPTVCPWIAAVDYIEMSMRQGLGHIPKAVATCEFVEKADMSSEIKRDQRVTSGCSRIAKTHANNFEINLGGGGKYSRSVPNAKCYAAVLVGLLQESTPRGPRNLGAAPMPARKTLHCAPNAPKKGPACPFC